MSKKRGHSTRGVTQLNLFNSAMPRRADVMLASDHAETQQGGVLDGIDQYELPVSTVTRIAKAAVSLQSRYRINGLSYFLGLKPLKLVYLDLLRTQPTINHQKPTTHAANLLDWRI